MRLNKDIKEYVIAKALEVAGWPEKDKKLRQAELDFAELCRLESWGGKQKLAKALEIEKRFKAQIEKHGLKGKVNSRHMIDYAWRLYVEVAGMRIGRFIFSDGKDAKPQPVVSTTVKFPAGSKVHNAWEKFEKMRNQHHDDKNTFKGKIRATLDSFTTIKKLINAWPEAAELLPPNDQPIANLPAVPVKELNKEIGLPSGDK